MRCKICKRKVKKEDIKDLPKSMGIVCKSCYKDSIIASCTISI